MLRKVHVAGKLGGGHRGRILVPVSGGPAVPADPPLTDGVVTLRPWTADDVDVLVECLNEPEIARWIDQIPQPYTEADARAFLAGGSDAFARFAVTDANAGTVLGGVGVHRVDAPGVAEIGYWARAEARGRGLTSRAAALAARWAIGAQGVERVQLRAEVRNAASRRVAEKAGFRLEGILRSADWSPRQQRRYDWAMYSLLPEDLT
ncbi:MAG: GNAT family N-acetyltransferase [Actinobacteria bacterium]|nr:MAG: GNAT family N-acetyltransferase [Actinomycetota bacterium]